MALQALYHDGEGYKPLVLTKEWQLAQLNTCESQYPENIKMLDQHDFTDETFTLVKGRAVLLTYDEETKKGYLTVMQQGVTYNVPQMVWHNIAMDQDTTVMITEGRDAHLKGFAQIPIPNEFYHSLQRKIETLWG